MILLRLYDGLVHALAALAATSLGLSALLIVADVMMRNLGGGPIQPTSALVEYGLLFSTMAGAPWLVRAHGHVAITSFVNYLPRAPRLQVGRLVLVLSIAVLALLAWRAGAVGLEKAEIGAYDVRSIDIPLWVLYAMLSIGFGLMAVEFLRLLLRGEVYSGGEGVADPPQSMGERGPEDRGAS